MSWVMGLINLVIVKCLVLAAGRNGFSNDIMVLTKNCMWQVATAEFTNIQRMPGHTSTRNTERGPCALVSVSLSDTRTIALDPTLTT
jgi:hypothetical protein